MRGIAPGMGETSAKAKEGRAKAEFLDPIMIIQVNLIPMGSIFSQNVLICKKCALELLWLQRVLLCFSKH